MAKRILLSVGDWTWRRPSLNAFRILGIDNDSDEYILSDNSKVPITGFYKNNRLRNLTD